MVSSKLMQCSNIHKKITECFVTTAEIFHAHLGLYRLAGLGKFAAMSLVTIHTVCRLIQQFVMPKKAIIWKS